MGKEKKEKKTRKKAPFILVFLLTTGILMGLNALFHFKQPPYPAKTAAVETADEDTTKVSLTMLQSKEESLAEAKDSIDVCCIQDIPITDSKVWSYSECFADSQEVQLSAAENNGIAPVNTRKELLKHVESHHLVDISSSPFYRVDDLSHSSPYLVPKAKHLLERIALNFIDSLQSKDMPPHLPLITSVLRTNEDVSHLQHGNKNATSNSCHCYGTTIDITYHRFIPLTGRYNPGNTTRYNDNLKKVLAEVLFDLKQQGLCYVKYERKQACFHLTVR